MTRRLIAVAFAALAATPVSAADKLAVSWKDPSTGDGKVQMMQTESPWNPLHSPLTIDPDAVLRYAEGYLFSVSRSQQTVTIIDPDLWSIVDVIPVTPTGGVGDLNDIAVVSSSLAYLTDTGNSQLIRLNLSTEAATRVVDMSGFTQCGPDLGMMAAHNGRLYVQVGYGPGNSSVPVPAPRGCLAVVDIATETLVDAVPLTIPVDPIVLQGTSAKRKMQVIPANPVQITDVDRLFVGATGISFDDGGIEVVTLNTLSSAGFVVDEKDDETGVDIHAFVMKTIASGFLAFTTDLALSTHPAHFGTGGVSYFGDVSVGYGAPTVALASGYVFIPEGGTSSSAVGVYEEASPFDKEDTVGFGGDPFDLEIVKD